MLIQTQNVMCYDAAEGRFGSFLKSCRWTQSVQRTHITQVPKSRSIATNTDQQHSRSNNGGVTVSFTSNRHHYTNLDYVCEITTGIDMGMLLLRRLTPVGHGQRERSVVPKISVKLIFELSPPDRFPARTVAERISLKDSTMNHHKKGFAGRRYIVTRASTWPCISIPLMYSRVEYSRVQ